jgi:hypothetical protein
MMASVDIEKCNLHMGISIWKGGILVAAKGFAAGWQFIYYKDKRTAMQAADVACAGVPEPHC